MKTDNSRSLWSRGLIILGGIGMVLGAIDPMEGAIFILAGSLLFAIGVFLQHRERKLMVYRALVFLLIALGVGAMWGLSMAGGFGGKSGLSMWWGALVLPYLLGWSMGIWGPGSPRWLLLAGIAMGFWYVELLAIILRSPRPYTGVTTDMPSVIIGATGVLTIAGCLVQLMRRIPKRT